MSVMSQPIDGRPVMAQDRAQLGSEERSFAVARAAMMRETSVSFMVDVEGCVMKFG
jgi:hypothetical protein